MIGGIVAEYNPFHNGHLYHIEKTKEVANSIIVALSPDVCQRGEFAAVSKYSRARAAILGGADLVVEIPSGAVLSGAKNFGEAAVLALESLGAEILSFGSETGDTEKLLSALKKLEDAEKSGEIQRMQKSGKSYPRILGEIIGDIGPNDTLALEYLKAKSPKTKVLAVKRASVEHDSKEANDNFASASLIRERGVGNSLAFMPSFSEKLLENEPEFNKELFEITMLAVLKRFSKEEIADCPAVEEGLENRIFEGLKKAESLEEAFSLIKTKRYTMARLRRIFLCLYLKIKKTDNLSLPYIRVLALNEKGAEILKKAKKSSPIPIITGLSDGKDISDAAEKEAFITDTRLFFCGEKGANGVDFRYTPKP